jgi:hypothetical protein
VVFKYQAKSHTDLFLRLLDHAVEGDDTLISVLDSMRQGIGRSLAELNAIQSAPEDAQEFLADGEWNVVDNLLGAAYVVCQANIINIVKAVDHVRIVAKRENLPFTGLDKPHEIRALGPKFDANYSKVEVLWQLGNFFKHREEWTQRTWDHPKAKMDVVTISVLKAAGLNSPELHGMRDGSAALGNTEHWQLRIFHDIAREWARDVRVNTYGALGRQAPT